MISWNPGDVILGDYVIESKLGHGGMGEVFLVKSQSTGRQFAVKKTLVKDENSRRMFLAELQTWIDLPEHPNIVPCRFFRTVGEETVIFADYIAGGSLADWIAKRKLTTLEQILDVAIRFAWGLHAIHERGLIHQDVKPGNVLMTTDGVPMVTDFGLARAWLCASDGKLVSPAVNLGPESVLISAGGMTPAYASPEQRAGQPLSRRTDIWSWGVSVLDMFMGGVSCPHGGHIAAEVFADFLVTETPDDLLPMPASITDVLERCFLKDPSKRWTDLAKAAETLQQAYQQLIRKPYNPQFPSSTPITSGTLEHDRRLMGEVVWDDPMDWLRKAYMATGRNPDIIKIPTRPGSSRRTQSLADLALYQEAGALFKEQISSGQWDLEETFAKMLIRQAFVHKYLDDLPGEISCYDQAIAIRERIAKRNGRCELDDDLALVYMNKANTVKTLGTLPEALELYNKSISRYERLVGQGRRGLANMLAMAYMHKACTLHALHNLSEAVEFHDQCIAIWEQLFRQGWQSELANNLAMVYMNKANVLRTMGKHSEAIELYNKCIALWERLVGKEGQRELVDYIAQAYSNKAHLLETMGNLTEAKYLYDKCIAIRERLVEQEGRRELANDLALVYMTKAHVLDVLSHPSEAVELYNKCIAIWKRLVEQEGRHELAHNLAMVYMSKAFTLKALGDLSEVISHFDKCIAIEERLVGQGGRRELAQSLASSYAIKATELYSKGSLTAAVECYDKCIAIRERLVEREGRRELVGSLGEALVFRADSLMQLGETERAREDARKGIYLLNYVTVHAGREDFKSLLAWAMRGFGDLLD